MMAAVIYTLCALTAFICAALLLYGYSQSRYRLLLWGGLCFGFITASNVLLVADKILLPTADLSFWRIMTAVMGMSVMLYGLIWDME